MNKPEIKEGLTKLLKAEKLLDASKEVRALISAFNELRKNENETAESDEAEERESAINLEIEKLIKELNARRKSEVENVKAEQKKNLELKKDILSEIQKLVENEEHIGKAFESISEIHTKWKSIGPIANEDVEEIQKEYTRLNELFFYNINIYKELKDYDLKKNYSLKNQVIHDLNDLLKEPSIKKTQKQLQVLQDKWAEIGPTFREAWEDMKQEYWKALKANFEKVSEYYKVQRKENEERIEKKSELVEEYKLLLKDWPSDKKGWDKLSKTSDAIFDKWKEIGYTPKKETEEIWDEFNGLRKEFYENRKLFYGNLNDAAKENAEKKRELIKQAEELKGNPDFEQTKDKLIKLQREWKTVGYAGKFADQKLWKQFRVACDYFFNALDAEKAKEDEERAANLKTKQELLKKLANVKLVKDEKTAIETVELAAQEINDLGPVPGKYWASFNKEFMELICQHFDSISGNEFAKEKALLAIRIGTAQGSRDPESTYKRERDRLKKELNRLTTEVAKYETNMGFFSKGAEVLLEEVKQKVETSKKRIDQINQLLRMIP